MGTIVIAHGGDTLWNATVQQSVASANSGGPVAVSFLMGPGAARARFQDVVARLEKQGVLQIVVLPRLVSGFNGHYDQIRFLTGEPVTLDNDMTHHLHMSGIERPTTTVPIRLAKALDASPDRARILSDRALAFIPRAPTARRRGCGGWRGNFPCARMPAGTRGHARGSWNTMGTHRISRPYPKALLCGERTRPPLPTVCRHVHAGVSSRGMRAPCSVRCVQRHPDRILTVS